MSTATSIEYRIKVNTCICRVCNKGFNPRCLVQAERLKKSKVCFDCDFWIEKWQMRDEESVVRINGNHYIFGSHYVDYEVNENDTFEDIVKNWKVDRVVGNGMGGARIVIQLNDGRVIITNDLWHQGAIPERFKKLLPDNAVMESIS